MIDLQQEFAISERRACAVFNVPRSGQRYDVKPRTDEAALCSRLRAMVCQRPRFGYRRLTRTRKREGWQVNFKRVHRLCRKEGLKVPPLQRNKRALGSSANACSKKTSNHMNDVLNWGNVVDRTTSGTTLKWLSIIDEHTRECVSLVVNRTTTSDTVIDTLAELFKTRAVPKCIRSDNGPEFISKAIRTVGGHRHKFRSSRFSWASGLSVMTRCGNKHRLTL